MATVWIGIDPGVSGAIAAIRPNGRIVFHDTASFKVKGTRTGNGQTKACERSEYDPFEMAACLRGEIVTAKSDGFDVQVAIERQQAMPDHLKGSRQGSGSVFRTGYGYGLWIGILATLGVPYRIVQPGQWKRKLNLGKDKKLSVLKAKQLFPQAAGQLVYAYHHNRAEALLLASTFADRNTCNVAAVRN